MGWGEHARNLWKNTRREGRQLRVGGPELNLPEETLPTAQEARAHDLERAHFKRALRFCAAVGLSACPGFSDFQKAFNFYDI